MHGYGGLERAAMEHIRQLTRLGVRVTVITRQFEAGRLPQELRPPVVNWSTHQFRPAGSRLRSGSIADRLLHYGAFARVIGTEAAEVARRIPVDAVHAHGLAGAGYARLLQEERALPPLVLNPHGLEEFSRRHRLKFLAYAPFRQELRRAAQASSAVIATDRHIATSLPQVLGIPAQLLVTIPNGVDLGEIDALASADRAVAVRRHYDLAVSGPLLVSVARLERNKGLDLAIAAVARTGLPYGGRWAIVGQGADRARLSERIRAHRLAGSVRLLGALPDADLHSLLRGADLGLVPSRYEGSSLAALELMAHAVPVVATATGGLPDKVVPGVTGYLAQPGSISSLETVLRVAFADRAGWPLLGASGRELVAREFDWPALATRYVELYRALS